MNRFISLVELGGYPCIVRADRIIRTASTQTGFSIVYLEGGSYFTVEEPADHILSLIEAQNRPLSHEDTPGG